MVDLWPDQTVWIYFRNAFRKGFGLLLRDICGVNSGYDKTRVGVGTRWAHDGEPAGTAESAGRCSGVSAQWECSGRDAVDGAGTGQITESSRARAFRRGSTGSLH